VAYKSSTNQLVYSDRSLLDRTDIQHAKQASELASQVIHTHTHSLTHSLTHSHTLTVYPACIVPASRLQVKYKESFDRDLKGQRPHYNPLDCLSFKHTQAAGALASQVGRLLPTPPLSFLSLLSPSCPSSLLPTPPLSFLHLISPSFLSTSPLSFLPIYISSLLPTYLPTSPLSYLPSLLPNVLRHISLL